MGPRFHACRTAGVWPKNTSAGNLTISHKKGMKETEWGQAARFQPPRQPRKKSSLKYSNTLHRERVCSLLLSTPVCCLLLLSSPQPSASPSFFLISLYLLSHLTLPPFSPLFYSAKRLPLCSEDETESVGLIIPDQSFASTSLPALLGSSWSAVPSEITSRRGTHSWILILINSNATVGLVQIHKMSVWWGQRGSVPPVIGVNCMHIDTNLYQRTFHLCRFVPVIVALIAIALVLRSSFLLLWQLSYNLQSVHFSIATCICTCCFVFLAPLNCILCREEKGLRIWCH